MKDMMDDIKVNRKHGGPGAVIGLSTAYYFSDQLEHYLPVSTARAPYISA